MASSWTGCMGGEARLLLGLLMVLTVVYLEKAETGLLE